MSKKSILDEYESDIEDNLEKCLPVSNSKELIELLTNAAKNYLNNKQDGESIPPSLGS